MNNKQLMEGKKIPKAKNGNGKDAKLSQEKLERLQANGTYSLKYKYISFNELEEQGEYNFYGIIYDASFPTEETNNAILPGQTAPLPKYSCILKLIDQNTNCLTNPDDLQDKLITLIIKSNEKESMPYIHRIGDIIRVHRGFYSPKKKRNVYLNILKGNQLKGSWCLFSNENLDEPYQCSHEKFTFESQDKEIMESMRTWAKNYFGIENSLKYGQQNTLDKRITQGSDYDLLVHIVKKVELDDQMVFFIQDETDGCELHTYKYFKFLNENDVIRVRSYKVFDKDVLLLGEHGNIEIIPTFSKLYKNFVNKLVNKCKEFQK